MIKRTRLYKTAEYWLIKIQGEIFRQLYKYMSEENLNKTQLAERLGVSKGYVTQILNGEFNFSLKKLIELSLKIGVVPDIHFKSIESFTLEEEVRLHQIYGDHVSYEDGYVRDTSISNISETSKMPISNKEQFNYG